MAPFTNTGCWADLNYRKFTVGTRVSHARLKRGLGFHLIYFAILEELCYVSYDSRHVMGASSSGSIQARHPGAVRKGTISLRTLSPTNPNGDKERNVNKKKS